MTETIAASRLLPEGSGFVANRVKVLPDTCTGCDSCSTICSLNKHAAIRPKAAGIRVVKDPWAKMEKPVVCRQCKKAPCVAACPSGALHKNPANPTVLLDAGLCSGCGVCVAACPFEAILMDRISGVAVKCDLCAGLAGPLCVQVCPTGALVLDIREDSLNDGRLEGAAG